MSENDQIAKLKNLLNLAIEELKHCSTFLNDHGQPKKILELIKKQKIDLDK